jgi:hypothetical protein
MSLSGFLRGRLSQVRVYLAKRKLLRGVEPSGLPEAIEDWSLSLTDPSRFYVECFRYFHFNLPAELRTHRRYFETNRRGFGEDVFHVMWYLIFRAFKPRNFLEIGVYRGQVLSLASLLQRSMGHQGEVVGISPFESIGDSVSTYQKRIEYLADTRANFAHFSLPEPTLLKAFSTDAAAVRLITSRQWDCIYIDGNHDYKIVKADWDVCSGSIKTGGLIVLDDASLGTAFDPPIFATKGHPGPSQVAKEIYPGDFREILQVGHNRVFKNCQGNENRPADYR